MQSQDKVDGIIKTYDRIIYSQLSNSYYEVHYSINSKKNNAIFDRINYLVSVKSDDKLTHIILCLQKTKLTHHDVIIVIKSVFNRDKNNHCYIFLENCLYKESYAQYF